MSTIDRRVVEMQFDNSQFESKAKNTTDTLNRLKESLKFQNGSKGLEAIGQAAQNVNLSGIEAGVGSLSNRFSTLGIIGMTVIQNLTNSAVNFGKRVVGFFTAPLIQGGITRALNLEQAKFQLDGLGESWKAYKEDILYGVKDTAYGLDEAARVASQLAASGYEAGDSMKHYLLGISGVAAMTGSSYQDIGDIFTTVAGNGRLMGEQLLQLSGRGINAAAALGKYLGKSEAEVRDMVSKGKIDFNTFAMAMDSAFGAHAKDANKTFSGAMSNVKAALARIGADVASVQLVNLRDIFNALIPIIDRVHELLMPLIGVINKVTTATKDLIVNALSNVFHLTKDGATGIGLLSEQGIKASQTMSNLKDTFSGIIAIFKIFGDIIGKFVNAIFPAAKGVGSLAQLILSITGALGRFFVWLEKLINESTVLNTIFTIIGSTFKGLSSVIGFITGGFTSLFSSLKGFNSSEADKNATKLQKTFTPLKTITEYLSNAFDKLKESVSKLSPLLSAITSRLESAFNTFERGFADATASGKLDDFYKIFIVGILGKMVANIDKVIIKLIDLKKSIKFYITNGGRIGSTLNGFKSAMLGLQHDLNADAIMRIAKATAILAVSLLVLSTIKTERMLSALSGLGAIMYMLSVFMKSFSSLVSSISIKDILKTYGMIEAVKELSKSLLLLSVAVKILSTISWPGLIKGLGSVYILLKLMSKSVDYFAQDSKGLYSAAIGLGLLAIALNLMVKPVKELGAMPFEQMAKGLGGLSVMLLELKLFMKTDFKSLGVSSAFGILILSAALKTLSSALVDISAISGGKLALSLVAIGVLLEELNWFVKVAGGSKSIISTAIGLTILSVAMKGFSESISILGKLSWSGIAKGLIGIGGSLVILAGVIKILPTKRMLTTSVALAIIAQAIKSLTSSLTQLGGLSTDQISKSLQALGGSLVILAFALALMKDSLGGSVALLVAAKGVSALVKPLAILSTLPVSGIVKALISLAAAFAIMGIAGAILAPLIIPLMGLSVAMALIGAGAAAFGAGLILISTGITALSIALTTGAVTMLSFMSTLAKFVIGAAKTLALGAVEFIVVFGKSFGTVAESILSMLDQLLASILTHIPSIVDAGFKIVLGLMQGIANNISQIAALGIQIVAKFIEGVASQIGLIIQAGYDLVISFINGLAAGIRNNTQPLAESILNLIASIALASFGLILSLIPMLIQYGGKLVQGIGSGISSGASYVWDSITGLLSTAVHYVINKAGSFITGGSTLILGLASGIRSVAGNVISTAGSIPGRAVAAIRNCVGDFMSSGKHLVGGFVRGLLSGVGAVVKAAENLGKSAVNKLKKFLKIASPSKVFIAIGRFVSLGFAKGINLYASKAADATENVGSAAVGALNKVSSKISDAVNGNMDAAPVITPVVDVSKIKQGSKLIHGIFDNTELAFGSRAVGMTSNISSNMNSESSNVNEGQAGASKSAPTYSFVQNNYSPTALSRLDIYRQTRNQFSAMKGLVNND